MRAFPWILVLAGTLVAAPAAAQQPAPPVNSLQPGARALGLGRLGEGTGSIEYWRMRSERSSRGLIVEFDGGWVRNVQTDTLAQNRQSSWGFGLSVGPALRRYMSVTERVSPYAYGQALIGFGYRTTEYQPNHRTHGHDLGGSVATGIGLEWFPVPQMSLSGQVGVRLDTRYGRGSAGGRESEHVSVSLGTVGSALTLNLYWPMRDD